MMKFGIFGKAMKATQETNSGCAFRPMSFSQMVGQEGPISLLQMRVRASKIEKKVFPHALITGRKGYGKSTFAMSLANELGRGLLQIFAPSIENRKQFCQMLGSLQGDEVVFIDEIHRLDKECQEILLPLMEDRILKITTNGQEILRKMPSITILGATTDEGLLLGPLFDRFVEHVQMEDYTTDQLGEILKRAALQSYKWDLPLEFAVCMASLAVGTPRIGLNLLDTFNANVISDYGMRLTDVDKLMLTLRHTTLMKGICPLLGLDSKTRQLLAVLERSEKPMGAKSLSTEAGVAASTFESKIEPILLMDHVFNLSDGEVRGPLICKVGTSGRSITEAGRKYLAACRFLRDTRGFMPRQAF